MKSNYDVRLFTLLTLLRSEITVSRLTLHLRIDCPNEFVSTSFELVFFFLFFNVLPFSFACSNKRARGDFGGRFLLNLAVNFFRLFRR